MLFHTSLFQFGLHVISFHLLGREREDETLKVNQEMTVQGCW